MFSLLYYFFTTLPVPVICTVFGTVALTAAMYCKALVSRRLDKSSPLLVYVDSTLAKYVLSRCKTMTSSFPVPFWARNAHVQTMLPWVLPEADSFYFDREYILMRDRGIVALDWGISGTDALGIKSPVLVIVPDVVGNTRDMTHLAKLAVQRGFRPVVFNRRGHGDCPLTTPKMPAFGDPADLRQAVRYIRGNYPGASICSVSTGTGSALLLSYLGEYGSSTYLSAGVCVSPVFDAEAAYARSLPQPYDFITLLKKKRIVSKHVNAFRKMTDVDAAMRANTLAQFEELFYSRINGYRSMGDYWEANNPIRDVDDIAVPVLCICSADDPVYSSKGIPYDMFRALPNFMLVCTTRGGHCGFLTGPRLEHWADTVSLDYLVSVSSFLNKGMERNNISRVTQHKNSSLQKQTPAVLNRISF